MTEARQNLEALEARLAALETRRSMPPWVRRALSVGLATLPVVVAVWALAAPVTVPNSFAPGDLISAQKVNQNFGDLAQAINGVNKATRDAVPAGTVAAFAGSMTTVPPGWLACDGNEYLKSAYPELSDAIGTTYGTSDEASKFRVPDYRGMFLRGIDAGKGVDKDVGTRTAAPGGTSGGVGSTQGFDTATHTHSVTAPNHSHTLNIRSSNADVAMCAPGEGGCYPIGVFQTTASQSTNPAAITITASNAGGQETRPVNTYVNYIIKY